MLACCHFGDLSAQQRKVGRRGPRGTVKTSIADRRPPETTPTPCSRGGRCAHAVQHNVLNSYFHTVSSLSNTTRIGVDAAPVVGQVVVFVDSNSRDCD
jgi:hypothetical protein